MLTYYQISLTICYNKNIVMKIFGERLKEIRIEKGETQNDVAKALNISPICYLHYEKNQREAPYDILVNLAKHFNVSLDYLFGLID